MPAKPARKENWRAVFHQIVLHKPTGRGTTIMHRGQKSSAHNVPPTVSDLTMDDLLKMLEQHRQTRGKTPLKGLFGGG